MAHRILVLNGPNLNLLGSREVAVYGPKSLKDIESRLQAKSKTWAALQCVFMQTNHEGALLDFIHAEAGTANGIILNPGAWTHTSLALRDAIVAVQLPTIEVHISNIFAREEFRQHSMLSPVCLGTITGLGIVGYEMALEALAGHLGCSLTT